MCALENKRGIYDNVRLVICQGDYIEHGEGDPLRTRCSSRPPWSNNSITLKINLQGKKLSNILTLPLSSAHGA